MNKKTPYTSNEKQKGGTGNDPTTTINTADTHAVDPSDIDYNKDVQDDPWSDITDGFNEQHDVQAVKVPVEDKVPVTDGIDDNQEPVKERAKHRFNMKYDMFSVGEDAQQSMLMLPGDFKKDTLAPVKEALNISFNKDPATAEWANTLLEGHKLNTSDEAFAPALEKGDWNQFIESGVGELAPVSPNASFVQNANLKGTEASLRLAMHLGTGSVYKIPLWHTGIWVTMEPASEAEILELYRLINKDKVDMGRYTYGSVFSNTSSYTTKRIMRFIVSHISSTTLRDDDTDELNLLKHIKVNDIPLLINGILAVIYPNGFTYSRACSQTPKTCRHISKGKLDFAKLCWVDNSALDKSQVNMMSKSKSASIPVTLLGTYTDKLSIDSESIIDVKIDNGSVIKLRLKVPTIEEYIDSGSKWIEGITSVLEDSLSVPNGDDERNDYIQDNAKATALRQYGHYISEVMFGEGNSITDQDAIEDALNQFSSMPEARTQILESITEFINNTTVSVIGIPSFVCPNCNAVNDGPGKDIHQHILPLDLQEFFFQVIGIKVNLVKIR